MEYNSLGGVTEAFVKWEEADSFLNVRSRRSYCIDRFTNELIFSDGAKADYPKVTDDVAFKVRVRSSNGSYGNVGPGEINDVSGTEIFVDSVMNPVRAYGGSNMETVSEALKRGANILSGRNRLVTINDYIFAILNFSDSIDKVVCIPGERVEGGGDSADLSFVLLMYIVSIHFVRSFSRDDWKSGFYPETQPLSDLGQGRQEEGPYYRDVSSGYRSHPGQVQDGKIILICPYCRRGLRVPINMGQIRIRCPHCGSEFTELT